MNDNTNYEKFTQEIFQALINAEGVNTVEVKHNVFLEGKSGQKHQIDVFWEYQLAGIKHQVIIECKNYNQKISIGKVRDFYSVLSDLNNVSGIIVSKSGYQIGAKKFASFYGINLKELRDPTEDDWKGRIQVINFVLKMILPDIKDRVPIVDLVWAKENITFPKEGQLQYRLAGMTNEFIIYDEKNNPLTNFYELDKIIPHEWKEARNIEHIFSYDNAFLKVEPLGLIKILGVKYIYDINVVTEGTKIDAANLVKAILKDAITDEIKFFNKDGSIK